MKKSLILSITLLFLISFVGAISTDMKSSYSPSETIITKISGNILSPLSNSMIQFKRHNVLLALDYGLVLENKTYYLWAIAPKDAGNYTLLINGIDTTVSGMQKEIDFSQNFSVSSNSTISYNVNPGAIFSRTDFSVDVFSFSDDSITIPVKFTTSQDVSLSPGKNTLKFGIGDIYGSVSKVLQIGNYNIPAYIIGTNDTIVQYISGNRELTFSPSSISESVKTNSILTKNITITNTGNISIKGISIEYNDSLFTITPDSFSLSSGESQQIQLVSNKLTSDSFSVITAKSSEVSSNLPVSIKIKSLTSNTSSSGAITCDDLGGVVCSSLETCNGETKSTPQGICCLSTCSSTSSSSSGWIYFIIIIVIIGVAGFIYYRYKNTPQESGKIEDKFEAFKSKKIP